MTPHTCWHWLAIGVRVREHVQLAFAAWQVASRRGETHATAIARDDLRAALGDLEAVFALGWRTWERVEIPALDGRHVLVPPPGACSPMIYPSI